MSRKKSVPIGDGSRTSGQDILSIRLSELITDTGSLRERLGVTQQAISKWVTGSSRPSLEKLVEIANYFNVSTDYLLGLTDESIPNQTVRSVCEYTGLSSDSVTFLHVHDVDPFVRSFYRELIDSLILFRDEGLDKAPDYMIEAAQAAVIAAREEEKSHMPTHVIDNTFSLLSKVGEKYTISASDAEKFFFAQALTEVTKSIKDTLEQMKRDLIEDFEKRGTLEPGEFQWIRVSDDELKELNKGES